MTTEVGRPFLCEWAGFRPKGAPSCPTPDYPYALACPWCPNIDQATPIPPDDPGGLTGPLS